MVTRPSCETDTDEKLQQKAKVANSGYSTCFPKSHGSGWSCFYLYMNLKKGLWFYMCREAFYTVLCNTLLQKKTCFCMKDWRFDDLSPFIYFPPQKVLLPFLDEVNCARRIKFWFVFISCMLSSLLLIPLFNCSLCWMCEAVKHSNSGYCLCWTM